MKTLLESITYFKFAPPHEGADEQNPFHVRIWREEKSVADISWSRAEMHSYAKRAMNLGAQRITAELESIVVAQHFVAEAILKMPRVNAVEVKDGRGAGVVLYKDWP